MKSLLKNEVALIHSNIIRELVLKALDKVNPKFYENGASSSGKYHPEYTAGNGGLLRHTQSVVYFCNIFCKYLNISRYEKDCMIAACILHDTCKSGINWEYDYTEHTHPLLVFQLIDVKTLNEIEGRAWRDINNLIATHMGQWVTSSHSESVLPTIKLKTQLIVHWSDYLASRKAINVDHYELAIAAPVFPEWSGKNSDIFSEEISFIQDKIIQEMVKKAIDKSQYDNLGSDSINKMKESLFVANQLLGLEETFLDEHDKDIIYSSLFFSALKNAYDIKELNGAEIVYWFEIAGMIWSVNNSWEKMVFDVCKEIENDSTLEINFVKEEAKEFCPATEKQVYRLNILLEEIKKRDDYDGKYDKVKPEKLSKGMAGKYISELKEIMG